MSRKIRIRSLGRIISNIPDFVLESVSGMLKEGAMTVTWATGIVTEAKIYYGYFDDDNLTEVEITQLKKYHEFKFPETYVDTYHYFRIEATNPITGETKTSETYRVFVSSDLILRSFVGNILVSSEEFQLDNASSTLLIPSFEDTSILGTTPENNLELQFTLDNKDETITVTNTNIPTRTTFETNITTNVS